MRKTLALLLALMPVTAHAAHFSAWGDIITLEGQIEPGDAATLNGIVQSSTTPITTVSLNSGGGYIASGVEIGQTVSALGLNTKVDANKMCASACVLIFASGRQRIVSASARIGVHQAHTVLQANDWAGTKKMADWIGHFHVSDQVKDLLISTPSDSIHWLDRDMLRTVSDQYIEDNGNAVAGKPRKAPPYFVPTASDIRSQQASLNRLSAILGSMPVESR